MESEQPTESIVPQRPRGDRSPDHVVEARVDQVCEWLMAPYNSSEVVRLGENKWSVDRATVYRYIARANERIKSENLRDLAVEKERIAKRIERIGRKAEDDKDYGAALASNRDMVKLLGIAAPDKVEHAVSDPVASLLTALVDRKDSPR